MAGDCLTGVLRTEGEERLTFLRKCFLGGGFLLGDLELGERDVSALSGFVRLLGVSCSGLWILGLPLLRGRDSVTSISGEDSRDEVVVVVVVVDFCFVKLAPNTCLRDGTLYVSPCKVHMLLFGSN